MAERLSRAQRRQQEFENDLAQQGADRQQQAAMLQQLQGLYGISQDQQMAPEKLRAMQAETAGRQYETQYGAPARTAATQAGTVAQQITNQTLPAQQQSQLRRGQLENEMLNIRMPYLGQAAQADIDATRSRTQAQDFDNQWAQPRAMLEDEKTRGQIRATETLANERKEVPAQIIPYLIQMGVLTKEEAMDMVLTPEQKAARQVTEQTLAAQNAAAQAQHQAQQNVPGAGQTNAAYYGDLAGKAVKGAFPYYKILDWLKETKQ